MSDKQHNDLLLDIIIPALKGYVQERQDGLKQVIVKDAEQDKGKFSYLLGQAIRHWIIPIENWHTSKAANELWDKIVKTNLTAKQSKKYHKEIDKLRYKEPFLVKKEVNGWIIPRFKGNIRKFEHLDTTLRLEGWKKYVFNDIFIAEHTTPVAEIMEALEQCYSIHGQNMKVLKIEVKKILNKIHITQMLKIEDRRITECQNRIALVKGNKDLYEYIVDTKSDKLFQDIVDMCYATPEYDDIDLVLSSEVEHIKTESWADALNLNDPYSIALCPSKRNKRKTNASSSQPKG